MKKFFNRHISKDELKEKVDSITSSYSFELALAFSVTVGVQILINLIALKLGIPLADSVVELQDEFGRWPIY